MSIMHNPDHCLFAIPKKGRLHEKVTAMLKGAGVDYHREPRLDIALCKDTMQLRALHYAILRSCKDAMQLRTLYIM